MRLTVGLLLVASLATRLSAAENAWPPTFDLPRLPNIKIDGDPADWKDAGFRIDAFAPADGKIVPTANFDAAVRLAWDGDVRNLLVLAFVADDKLRFEPDLDDEKLRARADAGRHLDGGDSVELLVAREGIPAHRYVIAPLPPDDAAGGPPTAGPRVWFEDRDLSDLRAADKPLTVASRRTATGYVVEALVPVGTLFGPRHPREHLKFQIVINDSDALGRRARHVLLPPPTDRWDMSQLFNLAYREDRTSPPLTTAVSASADARGRACVTVVTTAKSAGRRVEVGQGPALAKLDLSKDDGLLPVAVGRIGRIADRTAATFHARVPLPPPGEKVKPLNVYLDSATIARVTLPANDRERLNALAQLDVAFRPGVFAGDAYPPCDFTDPRLAAELIGPYTLKPTFYDADHNPADRPTRPGRYGAVVEVVTPAGLKIPSRLVTLFRQTAPSDWPEEQFDARIAALPPQVGVDPRVVQQQHRALTEQAHALLREPFLTDVDTPLLIAALAESKPGDPPLAGRNSIWARNERWWYPLKQKLGRARYEYRLDFPPAFDRDHPDRNPPAPVLLFLHGSGERGDDLNLVQTSGPARFQRERNPLPFVVVSPQCPAGESWSAPQLRDLLDEVAAKYLTDPDRVYVTGLSMGGYGAWELAAEYPDRFAAIAPICGGGSPADAPRLKHLPAWVFHGEQDREVPFARSTEMVDALKKVGGRVRFTPYPHLGHDSWTPTYDNAELYEWLLKQMRGQPTEPAAAP